MGKATRRKKTKLPLKLPPLGPSSASLDAEREACTCPAVGDAHWRLATAAHLKMQLVLHELYTKAKSGSNMRKLCNAGLDEVPLELIMTPLGTEAPSEITDLNLRRNRLTNSARLFQALQALHHLRRLDVSRNLLNGSLDRGCYVLVEVRVLDLSDQFHAVKFHVNAPHPDEAQTVEDRGRLGITALPPEVAYWRALEELNLSGNALGTLPSQIAHWERMQVLNLRNNAIAELPAQLGSLTSLKQLLLGANLLTALPPTITTLKRLENLELRANRFMYLPETILELRQLTRLHLGGNRLTSLSGFPLNGFVELKELFLNNNDLSVCPEDLGELKELRFLSMGNNPLGVLHPSLGDCDSLEELYLSGMTKLTALPKTMTKLHNLTYLDAHNCDKLKALPDGLDACRSLSFVDTAFSGRKKPVRKPKCKVSADTYHRLTDPLRRSPCILNFVRIQKKKKKRKKKSGPEV